MQPVSVREAGQHFAELIDQVTTQGITIDIERSNEVVARISPVARRVQVRDLNRIFHDLPRLEEEADSFGDDVENVS